MSVLLLSFIKDGSKFRFSAKNQHILKMNYVVHFVIRHNSGLRLQECLHKVMNFSDKISKFVNEIFLWFELENGKYYLGILNDDYVKVIFPTQLRGKSA